MRRDVIHCPGVPQPVMGAQAVRAGDFVFLGGQIPTDYKSGLAPEVKRKGQGIDHKVTLSKIQSEYVLRNTEKVLRTAGSSLKNGVRIDQFVSHPDAASPYLDTRKKFVSPQIRPASTHICIEGFLVPDVLVGLQLISVTDGGKVNKELVDMGNVPKSPGGPFAGGPQAIVAGDYIFLTGQIASDFKTGVAQEAWKNPDFWYGSAIRLQTEYVLKRLRMVLEEAGSSLENVVKADVWLIDMRDYDEFEEVWQEYFPKNPPARSILPVTRISDVDCLVEINMIALRGDGGAKKKTVMAPKVPRSVGHQPHAVRAGDFLFVSGLLATDGKREIAPAASVPAEMPWFTSSGKLQTGHILENLEKICRAGGSSLGRVVWTQNFYTNPGEFAGSLEVWRSFFPKAPPAAFAGVVHPLHWIRGCSIQMDAVAVVSS